MPTIRRFTKHLKDATVFAIEAAEDGLILASLDVTTEATSGGLCTHLLPTLPLAGRLDDVEYLNAHADEFEGFEPECGNAHHLMNDLVTLEKEHRNAIAVYAMAASRAAGAKKEMELRAAKVHDLLGRIGDRKPLPLFDAIGG